MTIPWFKLVIPQVLGMMLLAALFGVLVCVFSEDMSPYAENEIMDQLQLIVRTLLQYLLYLFCCLSNSITFITLGWMVVTVSCALSVLVSILHSSSLTSTLFLFQQGLHPWPHLFQHSSCLKHSSTGRSSTGPLGEYRDALTTSLSFWRLMQLEKME